MADRIQATLHTSDNHLQVSAESARVINAVSPTASVERVEGGVVLTVHDLSGTTSAMLYDGAQGAQGPAGQDGQPGRDGVDGSPGAPGQDGTDGVSPTITVTDITGGHRVTITDADGTKTVDVMDGADGQPGQAGADGQDGADGFSPTASVSKSGGTATITITDASGTTTATVSDGANGQDGTDGQDGVGVPAGGTAGQVLAKASGTDYDTEWTTPDPGGVTDVQVNGTSVVTDGVANIPIVSPSGETWYTVTLSINDYDSSTQTFLFDVGNGKQIKCAEIFGQIVNDGTQTETSGFYVGFGNTNGREQYSIPAYKTGLAQTVRRVSFATRIRMYQNAVDGWRTAVPEFFQIGSSTISGNGINVDTPMNDSGSRRATNYYNNFNDPRYIKIKWSACVATWASIKIRYTLE